MVYFPQGAILEYDIQVVERIAPREVATDRALGGEAKYGKLHLREDRIDILEQWMAPKPFFDYIPMQGSVGIRIPAEGKPHRGNIAGVTLAHSRMDVNMRDVGKYLSLHQNFVQHIRDYMRSDEGQALAAMLNKRGYEAEDIGYIAIGFIPERAIYAIGRLCNGKVVIFANKNSYRMIERGACAEGMRAEELIEVAIAEEFAHNFRRSYDAIGRIAEEKATKEDLLELYTRLANNVRDSRLKEKYSRIVKYLKNDIATIFRYARVSSSDLQQIIDLSSLDDVDRDELESILEAEAVKQGIKTAKGISEYKAARLSEMTKAAKENGSAKYESAKEDRSAKRENDEEETAETIDGAQECGGDAEGEGRDGGGEAGEGGSGGE